MFLLAVAVDDLLMGMTHAIRGEDLLASGPATPPSSRRSAARRPSTATCRCWSAPIASRCRSATAPLSVEAFREQGFLPEALVNYLALLGWSKDAETTFFTRDELVEAFDISRVSRTLRAFDTQKLEWMNNHYIQSSTRTSCAARCLHFLRTAGLAPDRRALRRRDAAWSRERMKP